MKGANPAPTPLAGMLRLPNAGILRASGPMADPFVRPAPNPFELLRDSLARLYAGTYPAVAAELVAAWIDVAFQKTIADLIDAAGAEKSLSTSIKEKKSWVV